MPSMYLALGYQCNHKCYFCPCGNNTTKVSRASYEELIAAIDQGIRRGADHITLSGGEPTLHPDFNRILAYCTEHGLHVGILSNGESFYRTETIERLFEGIDLRLVSVTTAIHSIHPEEHERIVCIKGSWERTVTGLQNLIHAGISVTVKQVISRWNYKQLPDFVDFVYRQYGPYAALTLCGMDFCGMQPDQIQEAAVGYTELGAYLEQALDVVATLRKQFGAFPLVTVTDLPLCCTDPYYWGFFVQVSRNRIAQYSAPSDDAGTIRSSTAVVNDCDIYFKACQECCVAGQCPGVWRTAYAYFGESQVKAVHPVL